MQLNQSFNDIFSNKIQKLVSKMCNREIKIEDLEKNPFIIIARTEVSYPIIYASSSFCKMSNYENYNLLGRNPGILNGEKTDKVKITLFNNNVTNGTPHSSYNTYYKKDGTTFYTESLVDYLKGDNSEVCFIVLLYNCDIPKDKLEFFISDMILTKDGIIPLETFQKSSISVLNDSVKIISRCKSEISLCSSLSYSGED